MTSSVSTKRSPPDLTAHVVVYNGRIIHDARRFVKTPAVAECAHISAFARNRCSFKRLVSVAGDDRGRISTTYHTILLSGTKAE